MPLQERLLGHSHSGTIVDTGEALRMKKRAEQLEMGLWSEARSGPDSCGELGVALRQWLHGA